MNVEACPHIVHQFCKFHLYRIDYLSINKLNMFESGEITFNILVYYVLLRLFASKLLFSTSIMDALL